MRIIAFNGFKRSGKGTAANFAEELLYGASHQVGFADKLKVMAALSLGYTGTDRELIDLMDEFKERGLVVSSPRYPAFIRMSNAEWGSEWSSEKIFHKKITGRQFLQNFGTKARHVFGDDFWVDQVLPQWDGPYEIQSELYSRYPNIHNLLITDERFPNEAIRVHALGGATIEIVRPNYGSDGHDSEQTLPRGLVDYTIINDGSLNDLRDKVEVALKAVL